MRYPSLAPRRVEIDQVVFPVELRKKQALGCRDRNHVRLSDIAYTPCWVCGHMHFPQTPYCDFCRLETMMETSNG